MVLGAKKLYKSSKAHISPKSNSRKSVDCTITTDLLTQNPIYSRIIC